MSQGGDQVLMIGADPAGRSWGEIGLVLGIFWLAARERYGQPAARS